MAFCYHGDDFATAYCYLHGKILDLHNMEAEDNSGSYQVCHNPAGFDTVAPGDLEHHVQPVADSYHCWWCTLAVRTGCYQHYLQPVPGMTGWQPI
jgi:hypothetical protein